MNDTPGAPAGLRLPRQASPVRRGVPGGGLPLAGVEADNIFDDIGSAFSDAVDAIGDAIGSAWTFVEEHPYLAPLIPLVLAA
jgi:hypothetical protein